MDLFVRVGTTVVQAAGFVAVGTGLYLLAGLAWTLLVMGVVVLIAATLAEIKDAA